MSLLHFDGFEYNNGAADFALLGWTISNAITSFGSGRRGQRGMSLGLNNYYAYRSLNGNHNEVVVGFAYNKTSSAAVTHTLVGFSDGVPGDATVQISLRINTAGQLLLYRGSTLLGTTTLALSLNQYYYIELKVLFHASAGAYELRVGNVARLSGSGVDTIETANAQATHIFFGGISSTYSGGGLVTCGSVFDDIYILNTAGSINNDFLGDCRVDGIMPNADGTHTDFTPSTGVNHYANVDEGVVSTIDYNYSTTIGHKDSYGLQSPPSIPDTDIYGFKYAIDVSTDVSGSRSAKALMITDAVEFESPSAELLNTTSKKIEVLHEVNPDTLAMWTHAEIDAIQIGVVVTG